MMREKEGFAADAGSAQEGGEKKPWGPSDYAALVFVSAIVCFLLSSGAGVSAMIWGNDALAKTFASITVFSMVFAIMGIWVYSALKPETDEEEDDEE